MQFALSAFKAGVTNVDLSWSPLSSFFSREAAESSTRLCSDRRLFEEIGSPPHDHSKVSQLAADPAILPIVVKGELKCEFSDDTKNIWSKVLVAFLVGIKPLRKFTTTDTRFILLLVSINRLSSLQAVAERGAN